MVFCFAFLWSGIYATHNRAGEISYVQLDDLTIMCTVTTYTKESKVQADRDSLVIDWGDGSTSIVLRENGPNMQGESLGNDIKKNIYKGVHTYPGRGTYTISVNDPNRIADIQNIPNSVNVRFFLFSRLTLLNSQFQGPNNGVILLEPPIDVGCVGKKFVHNPNAYDEDGDSLSFALVEPFQGKDSTIRGYVLPSQVLPGPTNQVELNPSTGEFKWLFPPAPGDYNIAIQINEYRNGVLINSMIRDMQIQILECDNEPPVIIAPDEICVVAGEYIDLEIKATDQDSLTDEVRLTASGGSFELDTSASVFVAPTGFSQPTFSGNLQWQTTCEHIRKEPYLVVFKLEDQPDLPPSLSDLHTLRITVVGPPPQDLQASVQGEAVRLDWQSPYRCEDAEPDYFYGFSVWRQRRSNPFALDTCNPGLDGKGYELISFQSRDIEDDRYVFYDSTVSRGLTYCYRVLGEFALTSKAGNPFNFVASLASNEVCIQLRRDQPLLLNVDVQTTDVANGSIFVRWTKPIAEELDTLLRPGPYVYTLERRVYGSQNWMSVPGGTFTAPTWSSMVDTSLVDNGLNTVDLQYEYQVRFTYGNRPNFRVSEPASSIFLNSAGSDRINQLSWTADVPWSNLEYYILRQNDLGSEDTIGRTEKNIYVDQNLINGKEYCYRVLGRGTYGIPKTPKALWNHSQMACSIPIDTVPPCVPDILATNDCSDLDRDPSGAFYNLIEWNDIRNICQGSGDVESIIVYYRPSNSDQWIPIDTIEYGSTFEVGHQPNFTSAGCYVVTAVDSVGNESSFSGPQCVENCPVYELPNVFTPNGDNQNDLFVPRLNRFIARVEFEVYNRWGNLVFKTENPELLWDGQDSSGSVLQDGTYFYKCILYENRFDGEQMIEESLSGYIEIIESR